MTHPAPSPHAPRLAAQPTLADQIAALRVTLTAVPEGGPLPAAVYVLIAAIFTRLFDRLEALVRAWQAGLLPPPPPPRARAPRPDSALHPVPRPARAPHRRRRRASIPQLPAAPVPAAPWPAAARARILPARARPRSRRAPARPKPRAARASASARAPPAPKLRHPSPNPLWLGGADSRPYSI
jgi:hypothetical protein